MVEITNDSNRLPDENKKKEIDSCISCTLVSRQTGIIRDCITCTLLKEEGLVNDQSS